MNASLMCRTAIGLLIASTTIPSVAAQDCDQKASTRQNLISEILSDAPKLLEVPPEDPCAKSTLMRGLLKEPTERPGKYIFADASDVLRSHFNVNSGLASSTATGINSIAIGGVALADGINAIALGTQTQASAAASIAIGNGANARQIGALAIGSGASARADGIALGVASLVQTGAAQSMALGPYSYVDATRGLALGYAARALASNSVALGAYSRAEESDTVSIGRSRGANSLVDETILRRLTNLAPGTADTDAVNLAQLQAALDAVDSSSDYIAINATGPNARAQGINSIAFGADAVAGGNGSVAFGAGAKSLFHGAYAIGANAQTSRESQFMIGTRLSNYTLPGLTNPQSRRLQTGELQLVTVDESGTLAGDGGETVSNLRLNMAAMNEGISYLGQVISDHALGLERGEQDRAVLSGGLALLDKRVTQHSTGLADLRKRLSDFARLPEEVDALGEQVTENTASIAAVEQTLAGGIVSPQDITGLDDRITQNTTDIAGLGEDVSSLGQTIDDHSISIAGLERSLAEGAAISEETAQQLDALDGRVASNAREIQQNAGSIQENRAAIEGNSESIARLEETTANGAARFDEFEASISTQASRMDDLDQSISTHADQITENVENMRTVTSMASENQARIARNQAGLAAQGEAISMLQTDFEQLGLNVYGLAQTVAYQAGEIETNRRGIAIANALAGASWLQANETTALTVNAGYFEGSSALAFSGTRRLHKHWSANLAVGTDTKRGEVGARAGLRLGW